MFKGRKRERESAIVTSPIIAPSQSFTLTQNVHIVIERENKEREKDRERRKKEKSSIDWNRDYNFQTIGWRFIHS